MAPTEPLRKRQEASGRFPIRASNSPTLGTASTSSLVPAPLKIAKKKSIIKDGSPKSASFSSRSNSLDDYYQEMSRVEASMELFNNNVSQNLAGVESEIRERVSRGESVNSSELITHHLEQKHPTPPESPTSLTGPYKPGDIKAHQERRAKIHQDLLKNETFGALLRRDTYFHSLMSDLDGLWQWWDNCRLEWRSRRNEMIAMEKTLSALATRKKRSEAQLKEKHMIGPKREAKVAEVVRLDKQYTRQVVQLNDMGQWFGETTKLMKGVKLKFKELVMEADDAEQGLRPQDDLPKDFDYTLDWVNPTIPQSLSVPREIPSWWKSSNPLWWLEQAATDLDKKRQEVQSNLDKTNNELYECKSQLKGAQIDTKDLIRGQQKEASSVEAQIRIKKREMQQNYAKNPKRRSALEREVGNLYQRRQSLVSAAEFSLEEKNGLISALKEQKEMLTFNGKELYLRSTRLEAAVRLAQSAHATVGDLLSSVPKTDITQVEIFDGVSLVHDICCLQGLRYRPYKRLREIINNPAMSFDDQLKIKHDQRHHLRHYEPSYVSVVKELNELCDGGGSDGSPTRATQVSYAELRDFERLVRKAEKMLKAREAAFDDPVSLAIHEPSVAAAIAQLELMGNPWGHVKSLDDAISLLNESDNRGISIDKNLGEILRDFFTSPDVAPSFDSITSTSKSDFFDLVDSFVSDDYSFTPREVEAFIIYCNDINELFNLHGDSVSSSVDGWELVDESPTAGPPRKLTLFPPPEAEGFARWMVKEQETILSRLKIAGAARDAEEDALFYIIRKFSPYNLDDETLRGLFGYFSQSGIYFRYFPKVSETGQPILRRINNGWNTNPATELMDLFDRPKPYFDPIRRIMTSRATRGLLSSTFNHSEMYDHLKRELKGFKYGGFLGMGQKEVTRHKFYLWLRWCDQWKDLFAFRADGSVRSISSGWDQKY